MKACWSRGHENEYNTRRKLKNTRQDRWNEGEEQKNHKNQSLFGKKCTMKLNTVYAGFKII